MPLLMKVRLIILYLEWFDIDASFLDLLLDILDQFRDDQLGHIIHVSTALQCTELWFSVLACKFELECSP